MARIVCGEVLRPHFRFLVLGVGVQNRAVGTNTTGAGSAYNHNMAIRDEVLLVAVGVFVPALVFPELGAGLAEAATVESVGFCRCHFEGSFRTTAGAGQLFELFVTDSRVEGARAIQHVSGWRFQQVKPVPNVFSRFGGGLVPGSGASGDINGQVRVTAEVQQGLWILRARAHYLTGAQHFCQHPLFTPADLLTMGGQQVYADGVCPLFWRQRPVEAYTGAAFEHAGRINHVFRFEVRRYKLPQFSARLLAYLAGHVGAHERSQSEIFVPGLKGNFFGAESHEPRAKQVQQEWHERVKTAGTVQQLSGAVGHGVISSDLVNHVMLVTQGYRAITPGLQGRLGCGRTQPVAGWRSSWCGTSPGFCPGLRRWRTPRAWHRQWRLRRG